MAVPTLEVEEYQYTDTGVLLNGSANSLPFVDVTSIEGLDTAPYRSQTHDREGVDGGYVDAEFMTMRTITIEGQIFTSPFQVETFLDQLKANFRPSRVDQPFYFQTDAGLRVAWGKSLGINYPKDQNRRLGITDFQVQILCSDPRLYEPYPITSSISLEGVITTGRSYPKTYPILYGAAVGDNALSFVVGGNRDTPAKLRINGPVLNPEILYDNLDVLFSFDTQIDDGDYIEIDLGTRSVLLNGATPRRNMMHLIGSWYLLEPGQNNFRFFGIQTPPTPEATFQVTTYSAWL
jgi:hypothetical protein